MNEQLRIMILMLLFVNIFVLVYLLLRRLPTISLANKIRQNYIKSSNVLTGSKVYKEEGIYKKGIGIFQRIDQLIVKSNIAKFIPFLNRQLLLGISTILGIIAFWFSYKALGNGFTSLVLFIAFGFLPIYALDLLVSYNSARIERSFLYFLNVLSNFAQLKDDVYFAFEKSVGYIDEPLNGYCKSFLEEVKRGITVEEALENFRDKVDNKKFKLFLKNAELCVRFGGSFLKLASNNLESVKQLQIEKARRKSETALGKVLIYAMMALNIGLAVYVLNLYPGTLEIIKSDFYGQVIVLVNTVDLLVAFYLSMRLQKLDY